MALHQNAETNGPRPLCVDVLEVNDERADVPGLYVVLAPDDLDLDRVCGPARPHDDEAGQGDHQRADRDRCEARVRRRARAGGLGLSGRANQYATRIAGHHMK